jgi:hypothetical protein
MTMNDKKEVITVLALYLLLSWLVLTLASFADDLRQERQEHQENIRRLEAEIVVLKITPTPTPTSTPTPTPTSTPTPTPRPTPIAVLSNQEWYDENVARGNVTPAWSEGQITKEVGGCMGPSGRETYYNLRMDNCVNYMRELGYDELEYPYWIRDDGAKMLGLYVMCAANWSIRPKGTIIPTSLGDGIVVDTGEFVVDYPYGVDIAVDW